MDCLVKMIYGGFANKNYYFVLKISISIKITSKHKGEFIDHD